MASQRDVSQACPSIKPGHAAEKTAKHDLDLDEITPKKLNFGDNENEAISNEAIDKLLEMAHSSDSHTRETALLSLTILLRTLLTQVGESNKQIAKLTEENIELKELELKKVKYETMSATQSEQIEFLQGILEKMVGKY